MGVCRETRYWCLECGRREVAGDGGSGWWVWAGEGRSTITIFDRASSQPTATVLKSQQY